MDFYLTSFTKLNSKDLNVRPETKILLEENKEEKLFGVGLGN